MEQKLSDTLVKAIDRSNPFMQNLQLASRFNKLVEEGGGADLEDNHETTIDVSAYTDPVEIEPAEGKDGMKKTTVTLSNIPSGADLEDNKEATIDVSAYTEPVEVTPTAGKDGMEKVTVSLSNMPEIEATKQATIDVSAYDPANKPVITPTADNQSMAEVEITLDNIPAGKEEQAKSVTVRSNGTTQIVPDTGKVLNQVTVITDIQPATKLYAWIAYGSVVMYTPDQNPVVGSVFLKPANTSSFPVPCLEKLTATVVKSSDIITVSDGTDVNRIGEQYAITI